MMYGRGYFSRGLLNDSYHYGYGFMNGGWNIIITIGVLVIITILIYFFVHNRKKVVMNHSSLEALNMKYVQGEITEEEYFKRKSVIDK